MEPVINYQIFDSPAGELKLASSHGRICMCDWTCSPRHEQACAGLEKSLGAVFRESSSYIIRYAVKQLEEYFSGARRVFDVPLLLTGTDFQLRVWHELRKIPYGHRLPYGELARRIGYCNAARAVAGAVARNPISIFVPCHRIVGAGGKQGGFAGGIEAKECLLSLEHPTLFS